MANIIQTWHKAKGNSLTKFIKKNLLSRTTGAISTKLRTGDGNSSLLKGRASTIFKGEIPRKN